ncbi:MAG: hypothetical protein IT350_04415 [Deltaproteobacteria bacterium]|nr:hypothetical protein [Deltaproteobacteria bacterium]
MKSAHLVVSALAAIILVALMSASVRDTSPVMDELVGPAVGVAELRDGDTGFRDVHPPLARHLFALPLFSTSLRMPFDSSRCAAFASETLCANHAAIGAFFAKSVDNPDALLTRARAVNWVFAALAMIAAAAVARRVADLRAQVIVLALFLTSPVWISNGALATIDMPYTAMCVFASAALTAFRGSGSRALFAAFVVASAAAFLAKFAALPWLGGLALVVVLDAVAKRGPYETLFAGRVRGVAAVAVAALVAGIGAFAVIGLYATFVPGHDLADSFRMMLSRMNDGHGAYLFGEISKFGWRGYFPAVWLLKSPAGTTVAVLAALAIYARTARRHPPDDSALARNAPPDLAAFALPAVVFGLFAVMSKVNIGVRYLLPIYPAIFIGVGVTLARAVDAVAEHVGLRRVPAFLIAFMISANLVELMAVHPRELSFVTVAAGGPARAARYVSDSNVDWGQDLPALRRTMERVGAPRVVLGWFGVAPPEAYGVRYQPLVSYFGVSNPDEESTGEVPDWLAVSLSFTTGQYVPDLLWLRDREPDARAGWSILLYDFSRDANAHRRLAEIYERRGFPVTAARHRERAVRIESASAN